MASSFYRATWKIPTDSGLPADKVNNVWSFRHLTDADQAADAIEIRTRLAGFYEDLKDYFSSQLDLAHCRLVIVDLAETPPRLPFYDEEYSVSTATTGGSDFPAEVAVCLSFRGTLGSGLNARRRRGRIYLGPLQGDVTDHPMLYSTWPAAIRDAATSNIAVATGDVEWCVYSPYTHHDVPVGTKLDPELHPENPASLPQSFVNVAHVWVDNAWDTQRRRGVQATSRAEADVSV